MLGHSPQWFEEVRGIVWDRVLGKPPSPAHAPGTSAAPLTDVALAVAIMGLCLLPKVLAFCLALVLNQLGVNQLRYRLCPAADTPDDGCVARVLSDWDHEQQRARAGLLRMTQHAGVFGLVASTTLTLCALLIYGRAYSGLRHTAAFTVVAAVSTSFVVHLSRILLRAAHRDASTRMFAWATRGELLAISGACWWPSCASPASRSSPRPRASSWPAAWSPSSGSASSPASPTGGWSGWPRAGRTCSSIGARGDRR